MTMGMSTDSTTTACSTGSQSRNHACSQYQIRILLLVVGTLALYSPLSLVGQCHAFSGAGTSTSSNSRIFRSSRSRSSNSRIFRSSRNSSRISRSSSFRAYVHLNRNMDSNTMLSVQTSPEDNNNDDNKFGFGQRIESLKCLVVGGFVGSVALAPFAALHDLVLLGVLAPIDTNGLAQWEFDNDMASLQAALFAIVYRYCIRQDTNAQLNQGVVGAFVVTRTLSRIVVSPQCSAIVLSCKCSLLS
jgi:hypothetical protein